MNTCVERYGDTSNTRRSLQEEIAEERNYCSDGPRRSHHHGRARTLKGKKRIDDCQVTSKRRSEQTSMLADGVINAKNYG